MKKTVIETPIVLLTVTGNVREDAKKLGFVEISSYEKHVDKTYIVVRVLKGEGQEKSVVESVAARLSIPESRFIDSKYSESGIDFINVT